MRVFEMCFDYIRTKPRQKIFVTNPLIEKKPQAVVFWGQLTATAGKTPFLRVVGSY